MDSYNETVARFDRPSSSGNFFHSQSSLGDFYSVHNQKIGFFTQEDRRNIRRVGLAFPVHVDVTMKVLMLGTALLVNLPHLPQH